jgi:hypothetical protein
MSSMLCVIDCSADNVLLLRSKCSVFTTEIYFINLCLWLFAHVQGRRLKKLNVYAPTLVASQFGLLPTIMNTNFHRGISVLRVYKWYYGLLATQRCMGKCIDLFMKLHCKFIKYFVCMKTAFLQCLTS